MTKARGDSDSLGVWGQPPTELTRAAEGARQFSPVALSSERPEDVLDEQLNGFIVVAPAGALERRYALAQALRVLRTGGELIALAPRRLGGLRLRPELESFGCRVVEDARRHHRICRTKRPAQPIGLETAISDGGPQFVEALGLWSQPGIFSWDRLDPGTKMLGATLSGLAGRGADLGCGVGALGRALLASPQVTELTLVDIDRRAIDAARRNIEDPRARFVRADVGDLAGRDLDFVVANPPFHRDGRADLALGQAFIRAAARALRRGGACRLVANRTLPYETAIAACFSKSRSLGEERGYKVLEALR
ncbi:MAG TPA: methyltransferase [Caulobacteraceae bacterium]|nr:methyltransferase [Caulobacteraceae bacterium]